MKKVFIAMYAIQGAFAATAGFALFETAVQIVNTFA